MGGGSLRKAPPSLPGRKGGAGGKTKGSGQGGIRALASLSDPAIVSAAASERMEASAWAGRPAGGIGAGAQVPLLRGSQGKALG